MMVGCISVFFAFVIGATVGLVAAYFGGRIDALLMRIADIQLSFPSILVALILLSILGTGVDKVIIALIVVQWAYFARTARGAALVERGKEYVEAARCMSLGSWRILRRHLLPNCMPPLIVVATIDLAHAIALEATLSFLGVGVPVTEPSLGMLISNGFEFLMSGRYWISFFPGVALAIAIIAINLVGDHLRDVAESAQRDVKGGIDDDDDERLPGAGDAATPVLDVAGLRTHFFTRAGVVKAVDGVDLAAGAG